MGDRERQVGGMRQIHADPRKILEKISTQITHRVGEAYLKELVKSLSEALQVEIVLIGEKVADQDAVQTVAVIDRGQFQPNFLYDLSNTPCANVIDGGICCFPQDIQQHFPNDALLQDMGVVSYSGTPLFDSSGRSIGIIALLDRAPMADADLIKSVVRVYSERAASELERQIYERNLVETNLRLEEEKDRSESVLAELREINRKLQLAKHEADKANRSKSEFLSNMSHEFRTPLNAVIGFAQVLKSDAMHPLSKRQLESVDLIVAAGNRLLNLVNQILDLARAEVAQLELKVEEVNINKLMEECLAIARSRGSSKGIEVTGTFGDEPKVMLRTDYKQLKRVVENLLANAMTHTAYGGKIELTARETKSGFLRLSVTDNGIGIATKDHDRVFRMFERLGESSTANSAGAGIGLAMAKRFIESIGGRIGFDSEEGIGSTFWLDLPMSSKITRAA